MTNFDKEGKMGKKMGEISLHHNEKVILLNYYCISCRNLQFATRKIDKKPPPKTRDFDRQQLGTASEAAGADGNCLRPEIQGKPENLIGQKGGCRFFL